MTWQGGWRKTYRHQFIEGFMKQHAERYMYRSDAERAARQAFEHLTMGLKIGVVLGSCVVALLFGAFEAGWQLRSLWLSP